MNENRGSWQKKKRMIKLKNLKENKISIEEEMKKNLQKE